MTSLNKREAKIRDLAIKGYGLQYISSRVKIHVNSVRNVLKRLEGRGLVVRVPNTTPSVYFEPYHAIRYDCEPTAEGGGYAPLGGPAPKTAYELAQETGIADSVDVFPPGENNKPMLPIGWANVHLSGVGLKAHVKVQGNFDDVLDPYGNVCGKWELGKPGSGGTGQTLHHCEFRLFGQKLGVSFRISDYGTMQFRMNPGRVYIDAGRRNDPIATGQTYLIERGKLITYLLRNNKWIISDVEIDSTTEMHCAREGDPLAELITPEVHDDRNPINSDCSPGKGKVETEIEEGLKADAPHEALVRAYALGPVLSMQNSEDIRAIKGMMAEQKELLAQQTQLLTSVIENITLTQTAVSAQINMTAGLVQSINSLTAAVASLASVTAARTVSTTPFSMEGYQ